MLVGIYVKGQAEGGVGKLIKKMLFSLVFNSLKVVAKGTVAKEQNKLKQKTKDMVLKHLVGERTRVLPAKGIDKAALIERLKTASAREQIWRKGMISGTIFLHIYTYISAIYPHIYMYVNVCICIYICVYLLSMSLFTSLSPPPSPFPPLPFLMSFLSRPQALFTMEAMT